MSSKTKPEQNSTPASPTKAPTRHRVVLPIQRRGGIGKSTEAVARAGWMDQRGITWQGFDLDEQNRTFSDNFPNETKIVHVTPNEAVGDIVKLFRKATEAEVTSIDPQAHQNELILRSLALVKFPQQGAETGVRLTVLVYPMDELTDMEDIDITVEALGETVDWLIVRNPARQTRTRMFDGSDIEKALLDLGAATLTLPTLLSDTRMALRTLEVKAGRAVSPMEALGDRSLGLDMTHRMILEDWMKMTFEGYDSIAPHLLPTEKGLDVQKSHQKPAAAPMEARRRGRGVNLTNLD